MTEPETLTAADRALLEHAASVTSCRIDGRVVARWMRCHDAALSTIRAADVAKEAAIADSVALLKRAQQAELARDSRIGTEARIEKMLKDDALATQHAKELESSLAAERAAREQAERSVRLLEQSNDAKLEMWRQAERDRDTALARARELDAAAAAVLDVASEAYADSFEVEQRALAAESSLTEATALLERCADELGYDEFDDPVQRQLEHDVKAFLSATSAPAATAAPVCLPCAYSFCDEHPAPAPAATAEPALVERIEFELRNGFCGDCQRALALIRAAKEGA